MQKLEGDGMVFVHAGGTVVERELEAGEVLHVDTGCVVALTQRSTSTSTGRAASRPSCSAARASSSQRCTGPGKSGSSRCRSRGWPAACSRPLPSAAAAAAKDPSWGHWAG